HGTPSDYTDEVSASTVQLALPDLEKIVPDFIEYSIYEGEDEPSPDDYKFWLDTSEKPYVLKRWDDTGKEWVSLSPKDAEDIGAVDIGEYQEKINDLLKDIKEKADLDWVNGELVSKANKDDVYTIEQIDGKFKNTVS